VPLGLYISVPFCRTKCSYCNFASGVFSKAVFGRYVDRVCLDMENAHWIAEEMGGELDRVVDTIYLGGGTPTVLDPAELQRIFQAIGSRFEVQSGAEITVECAPGTLTRAVMDSLVSSGVNRVSLGLQSFIDKEAAAVGRLHKRESVLEDIARLRAAGISNINLDLIAGLPHQTLESWRFSLEEVIATGVPHVSVYMLEVDEDSRLGRELMAGGTKYHAHFVPDDDLTADLYLLAGETLNATGISQYEISNFSQPGFESRHNLKYWTRQPYLGFGVDAHSMLRTYACDSDAVRFSTPDSLEDFMSAKPAARTIVTDLAALEERLFLGLRLNRGVNLERLRVHWHRATIESLERILTKLTEMDLIYQNGGTIRLTDRGRLLSNEVFVRLLGLQALPS